MWVLLVQAQALSQILAWIALVWVVEELEVKAAVLELALLLLMVTGCCSAV